MRRAIPLTLLLACGGPRTSAPPSAAASPEPVPVPVPVPGSEPPDSPPPPAPASPARAPAPSPPPAAAENPYVAAHNAYRKEHCAPPLTWSAELAKTAQAWADHLKQAGCGFEHSRTRYGENLAAGTSGALDPGRTTEMWYREVETYDWKKGGFSMETGHFTQVVWVGTQRVGCGMSTCKGLDIIVCNYDPPGNVHGQYAANVKPKGCKP